MSLKKEQVLIIGASGHAKVVIDIFEKNQTTEIIGLIDAEPEATPDILGYPVIGKEWELPSILQRYHYAQIFIAIGNNYNRKLIYHKVQNFAPQTIFANAIHPSAQIGKEVQIGKGVAIMAGCIINSSTFIGDFSIVNTKVSIDHDCFLGNFSSVAPGATIGGVVNIGEMCAIGIGATIKHSIHIENNTVIGAGSVVLNNIGNNCVAYGVPAKVIRKRTENERYL